MAKVRTKCLESGITIIHAFNVLHVPECVITDAEKAIWDFIWNGKPDKVKRDVCRRHRSAEY